MIIKTTSTGEVMVVLSFHYKEDESIDKLLNAIMQKFPDMKGYQDVPRDDRMELIRDLVKDMRVAAEKELHTSAVHEADMAPSV